MYDKFVQPASETTARPRRTAARDSTFLRADLHRADDSVLTGLRVRNLSSGGLMLETPEPFAIDEVVGITLRNLGTVAARVAWMAEGRLGIAFDREINPDAVRKATAKSPGTTMQLLKPEGQTRRPGLKIG